MWLLLFLFTYGCNNNDVKVNTFLKNDTVSVQPKIIKVVAGRYNEMSIAIDSIDNVTGVYEYYDLWDETHKEYMQICRFYFSGHYKKGDSSIDINTSWPGTDQKLKGKLKLNRTGTPRIGLFLNDMPNGYSAVDFTDENAYSRKLEEKKAWTQIRLIKSAKAKLYDAPDSLKVKKGYIVKNDIVKLISKVNGWYKIEYNPPGDNSKSIIAWLREEDIL